MRRGTLTMVGSIQSVTGLLGPGLLAASLLSNSNRGLAQSVDSIARGSAPSLYEIVVDGRRETDPTQIGEATKELVQVPGALGDPLSAVFSLPGVIYAGGDNGAPAIRGSGAADNLFMVDSLPVPYVFHTFDIGGSVFNDNILRSFNLYAAGYGPEYSNVTGGVFDIALRDPKHQPLSATIDLLPTLRCIRGIRRHRELRGVSLSARQQPVTLCQERIFQ